MARPCKFQLGCGGPSKPDSPKESVSAGRLGSLPNALARDRAHGRLLAKRRPAAATKMARISNSDTNKIEFKIAMDDSTESFISRAAYGIINLHWIA
jgi:hypothetical protein